MRSGSLDDAGERPTIERRRHPARQAIWPPSSASRSATPCGADAARHAVADGHRPAVRAGCASPARSASACYEFDSTYGFVSLDVAKRLFGKTDVDFIQLRVDDIWAAPEIAARIHDSGWAATT